MAERQTQISQRVGALLNGRIFNPEITGHLEQGHDQARESLRRIDGGDAPAAREPAAAAARELQLAADAMNRVGEEQAKLQLADAQHTLNEAADQARDAARQNSDEAARQRAEQAAEQARQAARDLAAQAQAQQDTGSSEAAKRLNDMARALSAPDMRNALEKLRAQPRDPEHAQAAADRLRQMAELAAQQRAPGRFPRRNSPNSWNAWNATASTCSVSHRTIWRRRRMIPPANAAPGKEAGPVTTSPGQVQPAPASKARDCLAGSDPAKPGSKPGDEQAGAGATGSESQGRPGKPARAREAGGRDSRDRAAGPGQAGTAGQVQCQGKGKARDSPDKARAKVKAKAGQRPGQGLKARTGPRLARPGARLGKARVKVQARAKAPVKASGQADGARRHGARPGQFARARPRAATSASGGQGARPASHERHGPWGRVARTR